MGFPQIVLNPSELLSAFLPNAVFIGDLEVDVLVIEEKKLSWESTSRPVDQGLDISDTRKKRPNFIRLEGWLTDTELSPEALGVSVVAGTLGPGLFKTAEEKKTQLETIADSDEVIQITTRNNVLQSMEIMDLTEVVDKDTGGYKFTLEAKQTRRVSSETSLVDPSLVPKAIQDQETTGQKAASAKTKRPSKSGTKKVAEATDKDTDPLRGLAQSLGFNV